MKNRKYSKIYSCQKAEQTKHAGALIEKNGGWFYKCKCGRVQHRGPWPYRYQAHEAFVAHIAKVYNGINDTAASERDMKVYGSVFYKSDFLRR